MAEEDKGNSEGGGAIATVRAIEGYIQARRTGCTSPHPHHFRLQQGRQKEYIVEPTWVWKSSTHLSASYILCHKLLSLLTVDRLYYSCLSEISTHIISIHLPSNPSHQPLSYPNMRKLWPLNPHLCSASGGTKVFARPFSHIWTQKRCAL